MVHTQESNNWTKKNYFLRVLIGIDQLANAVLGGNPDLTLSGRMGERLRNGTATKGEVLLCNLLSVLLLDPKHCISSIEEDEV